MEIPSANTDSWYGVKSKYEGYPTILRFRPNLVNFIDNNNYPNLLTIVWEFKFKDDIGMPNEEQSNDMEYFEDILINLLDPNRIGILSFVYTSAGIREWNYYINDIDKTIGLITNELANYPKYPIHFKISKDPNWKEFSKLLESYIEP